MHIQSIPPSIFYLIFYYNLAIIVFSIILIRHTLSRFIFLSSLTCLLSMIPMYFTLSVEIKMGYFLLGSFPIFLYPYIMTKTIFYSLSIRYNYFTNILLFSTVIVISIYILSDNTDLLVLFYSCVLISVSYKIFRTQITMHSLSIAIILILCSALLIASLSFWFKIDIIIFITVLNIIISSLIVYQYQLKYFRRLRQLFLSHEQNKRLTHLVSRLKTNIEQYNKIILEKDTELFQLSRHSSLAEITAGIAHELSQPLTGIKCISQNLIDDIKYEEISKSVFCKELEKICSLVDKSSVIIDHIRSFSRKSVFSPRLIQINDSINNAVFLLINQLEKNNIELEVLLSDSIPEMFGDSIYFEQLLINLLINGRDSILDKQQINNNYQGRITVSTKLFNNAIRLVIQDNGTGIPREIMPKIWSPFFTSKNKSRGTGIGLSISNRIIKEHKGRVFIKSDSEGTQFTIDFPVAVE